MWHRVELLICAGLLSTSLAAADSGLLNGNLGRWIETQAAPELAESLANHPRFRGETVRVVSMRDGRPLDRGSRLHQAVEQHLTQRLLQYPGVRIAWSDTEQPCGTPQPVAYLLGVELERDGSQQHKVNIGLVDVSESVWVSGVSLSWAGRLSAAERSAFGRNLETPPRGTIDSPIPVTDSARIAGLMQQHLRCALPEGLDGPLYLAPTDPGAVAQISGQLSSNLSRTPFAAVTRSPDQADWVLSVQVDRSGGRIHQLQLLLEDGERQITQQVAAVYVVGLDASPPAEPPRRIDQVAQPDTAPAALLSAMRFTDSEDSGICDRRRARANTCVEVSFELLQPAYLFVFSSRDRALTGLSCERWREQSRSGELRYRLRVPPALRDDAPGSAVYAIAVSSRTVAKDIERHLRSVGGMCGSSGPRVLHSWLSRLDELITEQTGQVEWRAIALTHSPHGVARL